MKRTFLILSLGLLVGLLALSACGGSVRSGQTSHPSAAGMANPSQSPALSSGDDLEQQLNDIEQNLNALQTSLDGMPALADVAPSQ